MKKQNKEFPIWVWIVLGLLVLILLNQNGLINTPSIPGTIVEPSLNETPNGECKIFLDKYLINVGESVKGTLKDGVFANCDVLYRINNLIWISAGTYQLDSNGEFYYETPITTPGTYEFLAICVGSKGTCKTNTEILTVSGSGDSDGDGFTDQEEIDAGTDPNDPNDFPQDIPMNEGFYSFQECGNLAGTSFYWRTEDGSDWTSETCQAYADSRCNAISDFSRNCCWWDCNSQITESVTHGGFIGCTDCLVNNIITIVNVKQGGTTYTENADYLLNSGCVDWSPLGMEPAPGSTYNVIYY